MRSEPAAGDFRALLDSRLLNAGHLKPGQEVTATIERVTREEVHDTRAGADDATKMLPTLHFVGKTRGLGLNRTNLQVLARAYGPAVEDWIGKPVTVYRVEQKFFGVVGALRVKIPRA